MNVTTFTLAGKEYKINPFQDFSIFDIKKLIVKIGEDQGVTSETLKKLITFPNIVWLHTVSPGHVNELQVDNNEINRLIKQDPNLVDEYADHIARYVYNIFVKNPVEADAIDEKKTTDLTKV